MGGGGGVEQRSKEVVEGTWLEVGERKGAEQRGYEEGEGGARVCERVSKDNTSPVFDEELRSGVVELEMIVNSMKEEEESKEYLIAESRNVWGKAL